MSEARPPSSTRGAEQRLQDFMAALQRAGLEPGAEELADALWLATHVTLTPSERERPPQQSQKAQSEPEPTTPEPDDPNRDMSPPPSRRRASRTREARLYPRAGGLGRSAWPFRAPAVPMLPDALALGRALRPLHRKVPSRTRYELDEAATVDGMAQARMARQHFWQPVRQRAEERWFDLALILDQGASMAIWQPLLAALRQLLLYNGAFRDVHTWYLQTDADVARLDAGTYTQKRRTCEPEELFAPRRLFLVVSDCTSRAWYTGSVNEMLRPWSVRSPLALLHLLPPRLWRRTALGRGVETRLFASGPGLSNDRLSRDGADFGGPEANGEAPGSQAVPVLQLPVLSLQPEMWLGWANMVSGKGRSWVTGVVFSGVTPFAAAAPDTTPAPPDAAMIDRRVQRFFAQASPRAQELAGYFAAAPLTIEVMRLVQQVMLPRSGQTHLAEVFVSGLLKRHVMAADDPVYYDFYEGVREWLLDLIGNSKAVEVLLRMSEFVDERTGHSLDFRALLEDPSGRDRFALDEHAQYFARIGAKVLRRLGGAYEALADRLEGEFEPGERPWEPTTPTPFRDRFHDGETEGPEMVWLPGGRFVMGDDESGIDREKPAHEVELSPFAVGKYPVTFEEYDAFCEARERDKPEDQGWGRGRRPIIDVDWDDAVAYCTWLSEQTGQAYRLLTEAQWEYACRAGSPTTFCFGDDHEELGEYAWYQENARGQTHPVGEKKANAWGVSDMHGNVWEWVQDWYGHYSRELQSNPSGPAEGSSRVIRGGSWISDAGYCRSAFRRVAVPDDRDYDLGLRLARLGPLASYPFTLGAPKLPYEVFRDHFADGADAPDMIYVPGGTFSMGDIQGDGEEDEKPGHEVSLDDFAIGRYPVTLGEYLRFVEDTHSHHPEWLEEGSAYHLATGSEDHYRDARVDPDERTQPAVGISWEDAAAYCEWLSEHTGENYTLPTEAEWEYACRAGSGRNYSFGDDVERLGEYAWYSDNSEGRIHPVGQKRPNTWGLFDTHGNVWEWVRDWYGGYSEELQSNPSGPEEGSFRVFRGGSWIYDAEFCRSACRGHAGPGSRVSYLGFRLARRV